MEAIHEEIMRCILINFDMAESKWFLSLVLRRVPEELGAVSRTEYTAGRRIGRIAESLPQG